MAKKSSYQNGTILKIIKLSNRVKEIRIKPDNPFEFAPGQFIMTKNLIEKENKFAEYTIVSSATNPSEISIAVDYHPQSVIGRFMHHLTVGDEISFRGPYGRFTCDPLMEKIIFISRNIGIVSVIGNLLYLQEVSYEGDIIFYNILSKDFQEIYQQKIKEFLSKLNISYKIITEQEFYNDSINSGKVSNQFLKNISDHLEGYFFLSGITQFFKVFRKRLIKIGIAPENIFRELF